MTPYYYKDEWVTLYHGDCREILNAVPVIACVITDPPYRSLDIDVIRGTTTRLVGGHNSRKAAHGSPGRIAGGNQPWFGTLSDEEIRDALTLARSRLSHAGALYCFADVKTGLAIFPDLKPSNVLVWDKGKIGMGYSWRRCHEWIAYCPEPDHELRDQSLGDVLRVSGVGGKLHPTEKPEALIALLLRNSTGRGDVVLDPFCGSGSTLTAAKQSARRAIGIEIEERYCEIAAKRLAQGVLWEARA